MTDEGKRMLVYLAGPDEGKRMLVYLAGPVDLGRSNSEERPPALLRMASKGVALYDATCSFHAHPHQLSPSTGRAVLECHKNALSMSDVAIFDLSQNSVGTPIEMFLAYQFKVPFVAIWPHVRPSLYVRALASRVVHGWEQVPDQVFDLFSRPEVGTESG